LSPLPEGEGQGEGERNTANQNGRTNSASSTRPAPRVRVDNHVERKGCRWWKGARSQAHWCFERCFPLTPPSPLGRGRIVHRCVANPTHWIVREPRPTGPTDGLNAKLLLSPIFGPPPVSVFNPCFIRGSIPCIFGWLSLRRISHLLRFNFPSRVDSGIGGFDGKIRFVTRGYCFLIRPCWPLTCPI